MVSQEHWGEVPSWGSMEAGGNAHPIVPEHACVRRDVQPVPRTGGTRDTNCPELPVQEIWQSQSQDSLSGKAAGEGPGISPSSWALIGSSLYHSEV